MCDTLLITRVANGWVIRPGSKIGLSEFTHIATTPGELAEHVAKWAAPQITVMHPPYPPKD